jgi:hypothetical protein
MTPDDIKKIQETIKKTVNGKIDHQHKILEAQNEVLHSLTIKLDEHIISAHSHWETSERFMKDLLPVHDGLISIQSLNKFIKWLGLPAIGAGIMWLFFNK